MPDWYGIEYKPFTIRHVREPWPEFDKMTQSAITDWVTTQMGRFANGYGELSGRAYFYYQFMTIQSVAGGAIRPDLRMSDDIDFRAVQKARDECRGQMKIKRRRQGATWRSVSDDLFDMLTCPGMRIGFSTKDGETAEEYLRRVKFSYSRLPEPFRAAIATNNSTKLHLLRVEKRGGVHYETGLDSMIEVRAPGEQMWEGYAYNVLKQDEIGKCPDDFNPITMVELAAPCLVGDDGVTRAGAFFCFGTAGDMTGLGGLRCKDLWDMCEGEPYSMDRFFIPGYWGLVIDDLGNDDFEAGEKKIQKMHASAANRKAEITVRQQYPLSIDDAFLDSDERQIFPIHYINLAENRIIEAPPRIQTGWFKEINGRVEFMPDPDGKVKILEHPTHLDVKNRYLSACDPVDHDKNTSAAQHKKNRQVQSDLAWVVQKAVPSGEDNDDAPMVVCLYVDRPNNIRDAYKQVLMGCVYYDCEVMVETNRYAMMMAFREWGAEKLLAKGMQAAFKVFQIQYQTFGFKKDPNGNFDEYTFDLISDDLVENWESYRFRELLSDLKAAGKRNTDILSALQGVWFYYYSAVMRSKERRRKARSGSYFINGEETELTGVAGKQQAEIDERLRIRTARHNPATGGVEWVE